MSQQKTRDSLLNLIQKTQNDSVKALIYNELAHKEAKTQSWDKSIEYAEISTKLVENKGFSEVLKNNLLLTANCFTQKNQPDVSLRYYLRVSNLLEKQRDTNSLVDVYSQIAMIYEHFNVSNKSLEYFEKSLQIVENQRDTTSQIYLLQKIGRCYENIWDLQKSLNIYKNLLNIAKSKNDKSTQLIAYQEIAQIYKTQKNYDSLLVTYQSLNEVALSTRNMSIMSDVMNNLAFTYVHLKNYKDAIRAFRQVILIDKELVPSPQKQSSVYINLGICYQNINEYEKSLENLFNALNLMQLEKNFTEISRIQNLLALVYLQKNDLYNAKITCETAIENAHKSKDISMIQTSYLTYSKILQDSNEDEKALEFYQKYLSIRDSLLIEQRLKEQKLSETLFQLEKSEKEIKLLLADQEMKNLALRQLRSEAEKKEKELELLKRQQEVQNLENERVRQSLELAKQQGEAEKQEKILWKLQQEKALQDLELKQKAAEEKKREQEIALLQSEKQKQKLEIEKQNLNLEKQKEEKKRFLTMGVLFAIIFVLVIFALLNAKRKNKMLAAQRNEIQQKNVDLQQKAEEIRSQRDNLEVANIEIQQKNVDLQQKTEEVIAQADEISKQKEIIEKKNSSITDSILYAKRIQVAILPLIDVFKQEVSDFFVLYKPKDIVSGDFYWVKRVNNQLVMTVADCTGHGVPGAFMSMLGISFLNEIVGRFKHEGRYLQANEILNELKRLIIKMLHQTQGESRDGMDMSLIVIDLDSLKLQYAGANNPLYLIRKNDSEKYELVEFKADKMPVAFYYTQKTSFTNNEFQLQKGNSLYLTSDGYQDQFGGKEGRKFLSRTLKELLVANQNLSMSEQQKVLDRTLEEWRGEREQIDDITIVGVKI